MGAVTFAAVLAGVAVLPAVPASAGAPNYECQAGPYRIGIDQHRRAGLVRVGRSAVQAMPLVYQSDQNGDSLVLAVGLPGNKNGLIAIREYGKAMSLHVGSRRYSGSCAFVPGNYVLGAVTGSHALVGSTPEGDDVVVKLRRGSLVWSAGRFDEEAKEMRGTPDQAQLRVVLDVRGGGVDGEAEKFGIGSAFGRDGRSTVLNGWGKLAPLSMLPNPPVASVVPWSQGIFFEL